jgi:hypothetical protein
METQSRLDNGSPLSWVIAIALIAIAALVAITIREGGTWKTVLHPSIHREAAGSAQAPAAAKGDIREEWNLTNEPRAGERLDQFLGDPVHLSGTIAGFKSMTAFEVLPGGRAGGIPIKVVLGKVALTQPLREQMNVAVDGRVERLDPDLLEQDDGIRVDRGQLSPWIGHLVVVATRIGSGP